MFTLSNQLLLSSDNEREWVFWAGMFLVWIPQLVVVSFALVLLVSIMLGLRPYWIKWLFAWVPHFIVYFYLYDAFQHGQWDHRSIPSLEVVMDDSILWYSHILLFSAVPVLLLVHIILIRGQVRYNARVKQRTDVR